MYQCMAYNDLDTRYSSGQLRVLGDTLHKEKWRPSFAKHPLEEKMFAAEGGNITIKYDYPLALTPNLTSHWFRFSRRNLCHKHYDFYQSNSQIFLRTIHQTAILQPNHTFLANSFQNISNNSLDYDNTKSFVPTSFEEISEFFFGIWLEISSNILFPTPKVGNSWDFYNFFFPKTPLQCMFAFDTSLLFQPLVINFLFSKSALKLFAKVFLKNYFSKKVYKKYFKLFFKMLFRNLPKACIKLVFKYSFKVIVNIFAKIYFGFFLIYLITYGKQRKLYKN